MSWKVLALVSMRLMSAAATAGCITFSSPAVTHKMAAAAAPGDRSRWRSRRGRRGR
eukprot:SM000054S18159  [mRNA]  locus=s54:670601:671050:- [translate_table: standard]